jgi:hypothetical protein
MLTITASHGLGPLMANVLGFVYWVYTVVFQAYDSGEVHSYQWFCVHQIVSNTYMYP